MKQKWVRQSSLNLNYPVSKIIFKTYNNSENDGKHGFFWFRIYF